MKILLDARMYGLENAGIGRYVINLVQELIKIDRKNNYLILLRKKYFDSLTFPSNWEKVLADYRHYTIAEQIKLPQLISKHHPDLVHFLHFNVPVFYKGSYVVTIHDLLMQTHRGAKATTLPFYSYYFKHLASKLVFRRAVAGAKKIIVPSYTVKDEVRSYFKLGDKKVAVTYEGVEEATITKHSKYDLKSPYFLYVGSAYPHKNLDRLVKAIVELNKKSGKEHLLAISCARGIFLEKLQKMINENEAGEFVKLLGFVPDQDLKELYKNSVGFVFPSFSEGFGLPGLEAMKSGTIVIASDIPVFKEIYKDNALYFDPYDVNSIKESMGKGLQVSKVERERMIKKAKGFVKRYSWFKMAQETLRIYEKAAESSFGLRSD